MHKKERRRRAKKTGCLFRRGNIWYAKWTWHGVTRTVSTGFHVSDGPSAKKAADARLMQLTEICRLRDRKDALAIVMRQMQTVEERIANATADINGRGLKLGELPDAFVRSRRRPDCSEASLARYRMILEELADYAGGDTPVSGVSDETAESYARHLADSGMSANTYNKRINALALAWRTCGRAAGVAGGENPWKGIARRRLDTHVRRVLTHDETDAMLNAASGEMKKLLAVMLYTGLRLGDACRIRWTDIRDGVIHVITAKRDRRVAIPLHPRLAEMLGRAKPSGYVMPSMCRAYVSTGGDSRVSRDVKRVMERCGISTSVKIGQRNRPDATAHSLRHTFVTRAIEAGVPPHVVQAVVGHSSAAMTEHYTHISDRTVLESFAGMT